ncbi:succinoglycan biosynthesis protein ExoH [Neorhizobium alkalisoli]|uniref:Succinoglycan biosynthesis protein ExoH n=2 Tax=Neorhizobium alkalisoli TaxID=528178 RepID=A0A561QPH7_9HYPH|nr:succinoglycan biosynthesis protein ExoH [Neorhizobium alkalisoli]
MNVDQNISSRINLMRIFLISGIVFVHVPFDPETSPFLGLNGAFDWLRVLLGDSLFRIGVPCLSVISGYLLFRRGWDAFDYAKVLQSKAKTVLLPFLLWNLGLFCAVLVVQRAGMGIGYFPDLWHSSPRELASQAFSTETMPINIPLYFLRDLMLCIVLSPVLAALVRRFPGPVLAALFVVAALPDIPVFPFIKSSIPFSFTLGIFLALNKRRLDALDRFAVPGTVLVLIAALALSVGLYRNGPDFPWVLDLARNTLAIVGAAGFWLMSALIIRLRIGQRLAATGSLSFWIFCAHYPLLVVMWMVWNRLIDDSLYPVFYFGAVALTLTILVFSNNFFARRLSAFYEILTGSRGRKAKLAQTVRPAGSQAFAGTDKSLATQQKR